MAQFIDFGLGTEANLTIGTQSLGGIGGFGVATFTGTSGNNYGTFSDVGYFNGSNGGRIRDICIIHQTQGTGAGNWELVRIINRVSTTVYFDRNLVNSYGTGAQIQSAPNLYNGTINGTVTPYSAWGGSSGGIIFILDRGTLTINSSCSLNVSAYGFRGGNSAIGGGNSAQYGDGYTGNRGTSTGNFRNGNGGSGFFWTSGGDGAGGHASIGGTVGSGQGGINVGQANLQTLFFGGGGGGGYKGSGSMNPGGSGGGLILVIAKDIVINGNMYSDGGVGGNSESGGQVASGGAGGSILIKALTATLGTNKLTVNGGAGGTIPVNGGAGSVGRMHLDYAVSYSGSATGLDIAQDTSIKASQVYTSMI